MKTRQPQHAPTIRLGDAFSYAWTRLGSQKMLLLFSILMIFTDSIMQVLIPLVIEWYFNYLEGGDLYSIQWLLPMFTIVVVGTGVIHTTGYYLKQSILSKLHQTFAIELADEAQRLPLHVAQSSHSADLANRIAADSGRPPWMLGTILDWMGNQALLLLLASLYMLQMNWRIALFVIILMPLGVLGSHLMRRRLARVGLDVANQEAIVTQCQQDALQGMETLRAYGAEHWMLARFVTERALLNKVYLRRMWWLQWVKSISSSTALLINWGSILAVAWLVIQGKMPIGTLMAFSILVWRIHGPLVQLGSAWGDVQEKLGGSIRIFAIWRAKKEPQFPSDLRPSSHSYLAPAIHLTDISFRYEENAGLRNDEPTDSPHALVTSPAEIVSGESLLEGLSLQVAPGSFTAIIGPSGSGKSTVAKLAAGLLFPHHGEVHISGASTSVDAEYARRQIAYVPQSPYLFSGTIRDNLLMVKPDATEQEMIDCTMAAQAHTFILSLPNGYDTSLKEHGGSLSGGERQRLALARAILADRPIWILDEATSALDMDTERRVMEAILARTKAQGRTLLVIAHRLTTVQDADTILVMRQGVIVEQGSHRQLLYQQDSLYSELWSKMNGTVS